MQPNSSIDQSLEIPLAKGRVITRMLLAVLFVLGSLALWYSNAAPLLGIFSGIFFLVAIIYGVRFLVDFQPGLVLDDTGLQINEKLGYGGMVPWGEIDGFNLVRYGSDYQLVVHLKRPSTFVNNKNFIYRRLNSISLKLFGSPVRINTGLLDYNRDDLLKTVTDLHRRWAHLSVA